MPNWLRWILLIPGCIAAYTAISAINYVTLLLYGGYEAGSFVGTIQKIVVQCSLGSAAMIGAAYKIAPTHKKATIIVISSILGLISLFSLFLVITGLTHETELWEILLSTIVLIATASYVCIGLFKYDKESVEK